MSAYRYALGLVAAASVTWLAADMLAQAEIGKVQGGLVSSAHAEKSMPSFAGAVEWLNSRPLDVRDLRGKVVLVDFWTYSCINWQRTLPYVRAWADKYRDLGLVVVGVHTPEFGFEKDGGNIREALGQLKVTYPVAVDSSYAIWNAFGNNAWPALYLVDGQGRIRYEHIGEGEYEQSERVIQQLLVEAGAKGVDSTLVRVTGAGSQADAAWGDLRSPETYVGAARTQGFRSPGGMRKGKWNYTTPKELALNAWALGGEWTVEAEAARLNAPAGLVTYRFHARDLHLVMGPSERDKPVPFRIRLDGMPPGASHGADVDAEGNGMLVEHRLYQLVRQGAPITGRRFEIEFLAPGVEVFSFTFG